MIKYNINLTLQFNKELERIYSYIYSFLYSPKAANKFYYKIKQAIFSLDHTPERYSKIFDIKSYEDKNLRKMPVGKYIIIYQVDNDNRTSFYSTHISW